MRRVIPSVHDVYLCRNKTPAEWFVDFQLENEDVTILSPNSVVVSHPETIDENWEHVPAQRIMYTDITMKSSFDSETKRFNVHFDYRREMLRKRERRQTDKPSLWTRIADWFR